ncbi:hypothetical protein J6W34_04615 [bacterium]|nr:hypothetical protein [bacterium]
MNINIELKNVTYNKHNNLEEIEITENGEYTASEGYDAIGKAVVNVEPNLEEIEITENGEYLPSEGKDGFSKVNVNVETYEPPLNLVLINPISESNINLPITFQWNINNLESGETPVYYLFVDNILVYKGNNTSFTMQNMPISGKNHTCYIVANSQIRSGFTNPISFTLPYEFLYGFDINEDISDPETSVTYTDDCAEFTPAGLNNNDEFQYGDWKTFIDRICRPVMLRIDGTVDYELDHDNQLYKLDGTLSNDIQNVDYDGNAMVEFRKIYMKLWKENNIVKCRFSDVKLDSDYKAYAFTNENGIEQDYIYLSMFPTKFKITDGLKKCISYYSNSINAGSGASYWRDTCMNIYNYIRNNGNGYYSISISTYTLLQMLCTLISKSRYSKKSFGYGDFNINYYAGIFIDKPCFYGKFNDISQLYGNKMFYMENIYSIFTFLIDGIISDNNILYYKTIPPYQLNKDETYETMIYSNDISSNNLTKIKCENNIILPYETNINSDYNNNYCASAYYSRNYKYMGNNPTSISRKSSGIFSFYSLRELGESVNGRFMYVKP